MPEQRGVLQPDSRRSRGNPSRSGSSGSRTYSRINRLKENIEGTVRIVACTTHAGVSCRPGCVEYLIAAKNRCRNEIASSTIRIAPASFAKVKMVGSFSSLRRPSTYVEQSVSKSVENNTRRNPQIGFTRRVSAVNCGLLRKVIAGHGQDEVNLLITVVTMRRALPHPLHLNEVLRPRCGSFPINVAYFGSRRPARSRPFT